MDTKTTVAAGKLFVKEVLARIQGNEAEALANKNGRKAINALQGQISSLNYKLIQDEEALENANERLDNAIYPTTSIEDQKSYCQGILNAQEAVDAAEANLKATKDSIAVFTGILNDKILAEDKVPAV